jgi:VIT1/CCC1 family predicted Fe2+/Mn2+ transporter
MDNRLIKQNWQGEGDAAYLYRALASSEADEKRRGIYERFAEVELRHQAIYEGMLEERGSAAGKWRPGLKTRLLGALARHGRGGLVLSLRIADETREVRTFLDGGWSDPSESVSASMKGIALDEAEHERTLSGLAGGGKVDGHREPWHQGSSGGFLRNVIYGFNDGLTANFGLVMGVLGGHVAPGVVLLTGVSGLAADALSMGGSGFLAAKSEQEVWQHEIRMEMREMELMPEVETEELALLYEAKGMPAEAARKAAFQVMSNPNIALKEKAREELGISEEAATPLREGVTTGISTAVGAVIPVLPFLFGTGPAAMWVAFSISMLSHFVVGAARSVFTGRGIIRSGFDMFVVGLGVAALGYLVGLLIAGRL